MGLLPYDIANGATNDGDEVQACLVELETNIQNINVASNAAISSSKLDLSLISQNIAFGNNKTITLKDASSADSSHIVQTATDHLQIKIGKVSKTLSIINNTSTEVASIDTSNSTFNAWNGFKFQAWASGNGRAAQVENDGTVSIFGSTAGDVALDPNSKVVRGLVTNDIDLGSSTYRFKGTYTTTLNASGAATVGSLTDGTATLSSGALSSATTGSFSGAVSAGSLNSGAATFTGLTHINGNFIRISNSSDVVDISPDGTDITFNSSGASVYKFDLAVWGNGAYTNYSDKRLKENIKESPYGLKEILQLKDKMYTRKNTDYGFELGVLAQDLEKVIPEAVFEDKNGIKAVAYEYLIPVFIKGFKELSAKIEA